MKTISVPLSLDALNRLDLAECLPGDVEEINLSDVELEELISSGVIGDINNNLGKLIDDYEDDHVLGLPDLETMLKLLEVEVFKSGLPALRKIITLTETAIENKTGVFFYF